MEKCLTLQKEGISAVFNTQRGSLESLFVDGDPFKTDFIGNASNTRYKTILEKNQWMGDWRFRVWRETCFEEELTALSGDVRSVEELPDGIAVRYAGTSKTAGGLSSLALTQTLRLVNGALCWTAEIQNRTDALLEVGEVSLAFLTNTDFQGIFEDPQLSGHENWQGEKQRQFHEQRVFQHLSLNGASSYALLQRPRGDHPTLLFQPGANTGIETAYQMDKYLASQWSLTFEGPYYLSMYSAGARAAEGWKYETERQRYSLCGNTSLLLGPKETKEFTFRFTPLFSYGELEQKLVDYGQIAVQARPGMAAPINQPIRFYVRCAEKPTLTPNASMTLSFEKQAGDKYFYSLTSTTPGSKEVRVQHGGRVTHLFFLVTEEPARLLRKHARFVAKYQFYENPADPHNRHHAFMPYDDNYCTVFVDGNEHWQIGALDEYCLPVAMFLAEKNALDPSETEIETLEAYIDDSLFKVLQNPDTYLAFRSMYWENRTPSDLYQRNKMDKERAQSTLRSFNYPLICDIYYAMYRIALMGRTKKRSADTYLEMLYNTAMVWFDVGKNKWNGAPAGATVTLILDTLKRVKPEWHRKLSEKVANTARVNSEALYPFGSELYVDQTAHNQLHAMMAHYGYTDKLNEIYRITLALRAGWQPAWFLFGNEKRGNVCCWYGTPLNSRVLYEGFEANGDQNYLRLSYAGIQSFLSTLRRDGAAHGWFLCWPDRTGFDSRSLDTDMGIYGYLMSARANVAEDADFGLCGYGCTVLQKDGILTVVPCDGVGRHVYLQPYGLKFETTAGSITKLCLDTAKKRCTVSLAGAPQSCLKIKGGGWDISTETAAQ